MTADAALPGRIRLVERLGNQTLVHLETAAGPFTVQGSGDLPAKLGDNVALILDATRCHVFGRNGAAL